MPCSLRQFSSLAVVSFLLAGCGSGSNFVTQTSSNMEIANGPPIEDVVTSFDDALTCLRGRFPSGVTFAVGQVVDATGKETYADGGTGKYITQGVGEMVQSALFRTGVSVVNRRDPQISIVEANWGIRDIKRQTPVNFYISGSVNSLDFIPGGGFSAQVGGIGPRVRQSRMLIALDLSMTDAYTGRVVASIPLQKQIYTKEIGVGANTFFGTTLVQMDAGGMEREALHFALRQMLNFATFELLGQLMKESAYDACRENITSTEGFLTKMGTADRAAVAHAIRSMKEGALDQVSSNIAVPISYPSLSQQVAEGGTATQTKQVAMPASAPQSKSSTKEKQAAFLAQKSTAAATQAIRKSKESKIQTERSQAVRIAAEALGLSNLALKLLQEAAKYGFGGDEGEVAAVVVQQAIVAAKNAGTEAAARPLVANDDTEQVGAYKDGLQISEESADLENLPVSDIGPAFPVPTTENLGVGNPPGGPIQDKKEVTQ